jgi:hypothetical protein
MGFSRSLILLLSATGRARFIITISYMFDIFAPAVRAGAVFLLGGTCGHGHIEVAMTLMADIVPGRKTIGGWRSYWTDKAGFQLL